jgi:hypothetical protein
MKCLSLETQHTIAFSTRKEITCWIHINISSSAAMAMCRRAFLHSISHMV